MPADAQIFGRLCVSGRKMMKSVWCLAGLLPLLAACTYLETPHGRLLTVDVPLETQHTVNKTVHIYAPPGSTVIYSDHEPVSGYRYPPAYPEALSTQQYGLIRSLADNRCLSVEPDSGLTTAPCHGRHSQQFLFDGRRIRSAGGRCLEVVGDGAGAEVTASPCSGRSSQMWHGSGSLIRSAANGFCLDSGRYDSRVQVYPCDGSRGQQFYR